MTTQQWQDHKFGPSYKRSLKWFAVDMYRTKNSFIQAVEQVDEVFAQLADALVSLAEVWEAQS